jgi:hypothetical protein
MNMIEALVVAAWLLGILSGVKLSERMKNETD